MYRPVAERWLEHRIAFAPTFAEVRRIRTLAQWDECVVAPRHGFGSAAHYYASESVAPRLDRIQVPTLMVFTERDPIVPFSSVEAALQHVSESTRVVRLATGGHLGFEPFADLKLSDGSAAEPMLTQVVRFLGTPH
jgi:predicted alpha/beta-fold hydrolase